MDAASAKRALAESKRQFSGNFTPYSGFVPIGFMAVVTTDYRRMIGRKIGLRPGRVNMRQEYRRTAVIGEGGTVMWREFVFDGWGDVLGG